ncbi:hypothetical protein RRG08_064100, partial [Elysia crispata]
PEGLLGPLLRLLHRNTPQQGLTIKQEKTTENLHWGGAVGAAAGASCESWEGDRPPGVPEGSLRATSAGEAQQAPPVGPRAGRPGTQPLHGVCLGRGPRRRGPCNQTGEDNRNLLHRDSWEGWPGFLCSAGRAAKPHIGEDNRNLYRGALLGSYRRRQQKPP